MTYSGVSNLIDHFGKITMKLTILMSLGLILPWNALATHLQSCQQNNIKLQVLGSGGPEINDGRVSSSHLLWVNDKATVLIDAGSGSAHQFGQVKAQFPDLQAILLTHLHVDHSADLPVFIKGSFFTRRNNDLLILGPQGNQLMPDTSVYVDGLFGQDGAYRYLSNYLLPEQDSAYKIKVIDASLTTEEPESHLINESIMAKSIGVNHGPISAVAWRVEVGGCSVTFSGDMSNQYNSLAKLAQGTDLLVANNAIEESAKGVARRLHMPPSEIGKIAAQAKVEKLILAHFMNRSSPYKSQATELIRESYQGPVLLAEDLMVVEIK